MGIPPELPPSEPVRPLPYATDQTDLQMRAESLDAVMIGRLGRTIGLCFTLLGGIFTLLACGMTQNARPANAAFAVLAPLLLQLIPGVGMLTLTSFDGRARPGRMIMWIILSIWMLLGVALSVPGELILIQNGYDPSGAVVRSLIELMIGGAITKLLFHIIRYLVTGGRVGGNYHGVVDLFAVMGSYNEAGQLKLAAHWLGISRMIASGLLTVLAGLCVVLTFLRHPPLSTPPPTLPAAVTNPFTGDAYFSPGMDRVTRGELIARLYSAAPLKAKTLILLDELFRWVDMPWSKVISFAETGQALPNSDWDTGAYVSDHHYGDPQSAKHLDVHEWRFTTRMNSLIAREYADGRVAVEANQTDGTRVTLSSSQPETVRLHEQPNEGAYLAMNSCAAAIKEELTRENIPQLTQAQGLTIVSKIQAVALVKFPEAWKENLRIRPPTLNIRRSRTFGAVEVEVNSEKMIILPDGNVVGAQYVPPPPPAPPVGEQYLNAGTAAAAVWFLASALAMWTGWKVVQAVPGLGPKLVRRLRYMCIATCIAFAGACWFWMSFFFASGEHQRALHSSATILLLIIAGAITIIIGMVAPARIAAVIRERLPTSPT